MGRTGRHRRKVGATTTYCTLIVEEILERMTIMVTVFTIVAMVETEKTADCNKVVVFHFAFLAFGIQCLLSTQ